MLARYSLYYMFYAARYACCISPQITHIERTFLKENTTLSKYLINLHIQEKSRYAYTNTNTHIEIICPSWKWWHWMAHIKRKRSFESWEQMHIPRCAFWVCDSLILVQLWYWANWFWSIFLSNHLQKWKNDQQK